MVAVECFGVSVSACLLRPCGSISGSGRRFGVAGAAHSGSGSVCRGCFREGRAAPAGVGRATGVMLTISAYAPVSFKGRSV